MPHFHRPAPKVGAGAHFHPHTVNHAHVPHHDKTQPLHATIVHAHGADEHGRHHVNVTVHDSDGRVHAFQKVPLYHPGEPHPDNKGHVVLDLD
jgi:hypothetical protein